MITPTVNVNINDNTIKYKNVNDKKNNAKGKMLITMNQNRTITKSKSENYKVVNSLVNTIIYDKISKTIYFTIPEIFHKDVNGFIHISGHEQLSYVSSIYFF